MKRRRSNMKRKARSMNRSRTRRMKRSRKTNYRRRRRRSRKTSRKKNEIGGAKQQYIARCMPPGVASPVTRGGLSEGQLQANKKAKCVQEGEDADSLYARIENGETTDDNIPFRDELSACERAITLRQMRESSTDEGHCKEWKQIGTALGNRWV